jgi:hypothetical protein
MMASDCRTMFTRLIDAFQARFGVSAVECRDLLKAMQREWEENQSTYSVAFAFGRKAD